MKKILAFLLGCIAASGAYAQLRTWFYFDFNSNLFNSVIPTGMYAEQTMINTDGNEVPNTGTPNLDPVWLYNDITPGRYIPKGDYSFFVPRLSPGNNPGLNNISRTTSARLNVYYTKGIFTGTIGFSYGDGFTALMNNPYDQKPTIGSWFSNIRLDTFDVHFNLRLFSFSVSKSALPLANNTYSFNSWTEGLAFSCAGFGVLVPATPSQSYIFQGISNDFRSQPGIGNMTVFNEVFNLATSIRLLDYYLFIPVTVDLAMSVGYNSPTGSFTEPSQARIGGGVAFRGKSVADLFNYDLVYMVTGGDPTLNDSWDKDINPGGSYQPDGRGVMNHYLSLAVGFPTLIPNLDFSTAYNVMFALYEDDKTNAKPGDINPYTVTRTGPVYHGIDLHLLYTGIPGLNIYMQNRVSFAHAREPDYNGDLGLITGESRNIYSSAFLLQNRSQDWFALFNSLTFRYPFLRMIAYLELTQKLGIATEYNSDEIAREQGRQQDWGKSQRMRYILQAAAYISFSVGGFLENCSIESGLNVWVENNKTTFSDYRRVNFKGPTSWEGGGIGISFPIRLVMAFP